LTEKEDFVSIINFWHQSNDKFEVEVALLQNQDNPASPSLRLDLNLDKHLIEL
jgi:hypothetical protein